MCREPGTRGQHSTATILSMYSPSYSGYGGGYGGGGVAVYGGSRYNQYYGQSYSYR